MKAVRLYARIGLLLLLAVLLPVRGAVAAAMLCPAGEASHAHHALQVQDHATAFDAMDHDTAHDHGATQHHGRTGHGTGGGHAVSDKCNLCAACCSLTPLVSAVPTVVAPMAFTACRLCDHAAPPPSFLSDGQERPPRSL